MEKNVLTFIGCDADYDAAKIVIFGAPFDGTTTFRAGTRFATQAIRPDSYGLETYSPYQDKDLLDYNNYIDVGDLELPFGNKERVLDAIEEMVAKIIEDKKTPFMIGGEHLVSLPAIKACAEKFNDLCVIHIDAHTDLREDFMGEKLSHSSVIRRAWDILGNDRIFQFGIRSGLKEEFVWASEGHTHLQKFNLNGFVDVVKKLQGKPIYLTIDLDVLDPSIFSGTGTPEAGGISYNDLQSAIETVGCLNIVGLDVVELSPHYDVSGVSTAVACKVIRELLLTCSY